MFKIYKYEGKDRDQLLAECQNETQTSLDKLYINESVSEVGLFKSKKYVIEVAKKEDVIAFIKEFIKKVCSLMGINIDMEIYEKDDIINVSLASDNNPILIGKEGRTLNSIQILLRQALKTNNDFNIKVTLDASNYRSKKVDRLEKSIKEIAREVLKTKIAVKLDPMNSYERRIVHSVIAEFKDLESVSTGEEPNRFVTIKYREEE